MIKLLKLGSGYTWPGHVIMETFPNTLDVIKKKLPNKVVVITGTNGKTTTVKLIRHIFEKEGYKVLSNETGANLINGVVSSILLNSKVDGSLPYDVAVFELDELNVTDFLKSVKPNVVALLNISRDQLDRYWEKEIVLESWKSGLRKLKEDTLLVLDKEQKQFEELERLHIGKTKYFDNSKHVLNNTNLTGSFNAKNVNCALLIAEHLGLDKKEANENLGDFDYAYGRGELFEYEGKDFQIYLAKNPESLNQNLKLLIEEDTEYDTLLYILNDNIPDGRDVSWIFDVDSKLLKKCSDGKKIYVAGTRALDMAVRLEYAGIDVSEDSVSEDMSEVVKMIRDSDNKKIVVLPNYSSMLEFRGLVLGRKIL